MWLTPYRSSTSSARSASSWLARASAAAPNRVAELWWPVRPNGRRSIMDEILARPWREEAGAAEVDPHGGAGLMDPRPLLTLSLLLDKGDALGLALELLVLELRPA